MTRARLLLGIWLGAAPTAPQEAPPPVPQTHSTPAPADDRLREVRERRRQLEAEVSQLRSQEKSLLGEVERLDAEERLRTTQLRETKLLLDRTNAELDRTIAQAQALTRSVQETRPMLAARARALYKLGELSYLRLLLSVEHPADLFRGYRFVTTLARRDRERLAAFRADLVALAKTQAELEERTRETQALRTDLERTRRSLEADRKRKTALLTRIVEKKETHAAYVQELNEAEARLGRLLDGFHQSDVSVPIAAFRGALPWPVSGRVRVPFGLRKHPRFETFTAHNGIEIDAPLDAPVSAVHEGEVLFAERFQGYGLMVVVDHGGKHHSLYAHLSEITVAVGQRVAEGELLGRVGNVGLEPALYFEMRFQGRPEDPAEWLKRGERAEP